MDTFLKNITATLSLWRLSKMSQSKEKTLINNESIEIHCSQLPYWTKCERKREYQLYYPSVRDEVKHKIAPWVGTAVHALVAGKDWPEKPEEMVFDAKTPNWKIAKRQVAAMYGQIKQILDYRFCHSKRLHEVTFPPKWRHGWASNLYLTGTADLIVNYAYSDVTQIFDIKTGADYQDAWIQLGGYAWLSQMMNADKDQQVGVIHCQRPEMGETPKVNIVLKTEKQTDAIKNTAIAVMDRISHILTQHVFAVQSPSLQCDWCPDEACVFNNSKR